MSIRSLLSIFAFAISLSFLGCDSPNKLSTSGLLATGKVGEIVVVCDQGIWESEIKNYLDTGLTRFITPYMPDVVTFELNHRTPDRFVHGIRRHRNVLFLTVDPNHTGDAAKVEKRMDVWANEQIVIDIIGKDFNQLLEVCAGGMDAIHKEYDEYSWKRIMNRFEKVSISSARDAVKDNFGISIDIPKNSKLVTKRPNFYRIEFPEGSRPIEFVGAGSQDAGTIFSGLMVYQYDFIDSTQLAFENLLQARDTMLKYNVPSEIDGMYMGTQYNEIFYPEHSTMQSADGNVTGTEIRGMFVFKGLPRFGTGGAFWEYHFVHPTKKKVICLSGYVDAPPTTSWTQPIRDIQAVLKSVEIVQ